MRMALNSWFRRPHGGLANMVRTENGSGRRLTRVSHCLSATARARTLFWTFHGARACSPMAAVGLSRPHRKRRRSCYSRGTWRLPDPKKKRSIKSNWNERDENQIFTANRDTIGGDLL